MGISAQTLIPQRPPIVMIDTFHGITDGHSYSSLQVLEDNILVKNGLLVESGVIEHIAQSAAARVGYLAHLQNVAPPVGFIGSIDNFKLKHLPRVGDTLFTRITVEQEFENITLISAATAIAATFDEQKVIATCQMKIFLQRD
ncbi:MAG: hydroxymyristoyl-ACP dehydratase [Bacteroidales bacterium]|jgi:predicted hotdog family 3-hydroxylacyl-ACP dehydratase|nr:hydroxymyristoyl-ACP dehydratase [Bacteroidales bacterium]